MITAKILDAKERGLGGLTFASYVNTILMKGVSIEINKTLKSALMKYLIANLNQFGR